MGKVPLWGPEQSLKEEVQVKKQSPERRAKKKKG